MVWTGRDRRLALVQALVLVSGVTALQASSTARAAPPLMCSRERSCAAAGVREWPAAAPPARTAARGIELYDDYEASIRLLLDEIRDTSAGDRIELGLYLLEGGKSSEQVLKALEAAGAERGVRVRFGVDVSYVSMISRLTEKTDTLIPRVTAMSDEQPQWCTVVYKYKPDHGKFALFLRKDSSTSSAIVGGMNLGDRFRGWRDYTVRIPANAVDELCCCLWGCAGARDLPICQGYHDGSSLATQGGDRLRLNVAAAVPSRIVSEAASRSAVTGVIASAAIGWFFVPAALLGPFFFFITQGTTAELNLIAAMAGGAVAATLGIATDGNRFSLGRELLHLGRALAFDRSKLGDALAPCRPMLISLFRKDVEGTFAVQTEGAIQAVSLQMAAARELRYRNPSTLSMSRTNICFAANRRGISRNDIEPTFRALFDDDRFNYYRVVMAYLGPRWGVELIETALRRGARVNLLIPARANVYAASNLRAAQALLDGGWPNLRISFHKEMVHAKAILASGVCAHNDAQAEGVQRAENVFRVGASMNSKSQPLQMAMLGSANLVRGSMNLPVWLDLLPYDELNVCVSEPSFCSALSASMDDLWTGADEIDAQARLLDGDDWAELRGAVRYSKWRAEWEELWQ